MPEPRDDLMLALRELGERLDVSPSDPVAVAIARLRTTRTPPGRDGAPWRPGPGGRRLLLAAAAALLVALAATLLAPASRDAVARWLGIGSVTVTYTNDVPAAAGRTYDLGNPVSPSRAAERANAAGWRLAAPAAAGDPARAFVGRPAGAVNLTWAPSAERPEIADSGIGLLFTALPGTTDAGGMAKQATGGTTIQLVRVGDRPAYWIEGEPHEVVLTDRNGDIVHDSSRLAGNALIWTEDDVTYRLESALERDEAIGLASTLRPLA
jgi:hypothetical protein